jgi:hypothetical protein
MPGRKISTACTITDARYPFLAKLGGLSLPYCRFGKRYTAKVWRLPKTVLDMRRA